LISAEKGNVYMKRYLTALAAAGLAVSLAGAAHAQLFSHFETVNPPAGGTAVSGLSSLQLLAGANNGKFAGGGGTDVVLANLRVESTQNDLTPDTFNVPYEIVMSLTDDASGDSTPPLLPSLVFQGILSGTASQGAANINNLNTGNSSYNVVLGGQTYTVEIGTYTAPEAPGGRLGAIGAHVTARGAVPEPGSLALLGGGLLPLLGMMRRKR
jgi:hypothetical protein